MKVEVSKQSNNEKESDLNLPSGHTMDDDIRSRNRLWWHHRVHLHRPHRRLHRLPHHHTFHLVKYVDEEDWQTKSSVSSIDHVTDHYSDHDDDKIPGMICHDNMIPHDGRDHPCFHSGSDHVTDHYSDPDGVIDLHDDDEWKLMNQSRCCPYCHHPSARKHGQHDRTMMQVMEHLYHVQLGEKVDSLRSTSSGPKVKTPLRSALRKTYVARSV